MQSTAPTTWHNLGLPVQESGPRLARKGTGCHGGSGAGVDLQRQAGHLDWHTVCGHKPGEHTSLQSYSHLSQCISPAQEGTTYHGDIPANLGVGGPHQACRPMVYCGHNVQLGPGGLHPHELKRQGGTGTNQRGHKGQGPVNRGPRQSSE